MSEALFRARRGRMPRARRRTWEISPSVGSSFSPKGGHAAGACPGRADGRGKFIQVSEALFRPNAGTTRALPGAATDVGNFSKCRKLFFAQRRARRGRCRRMPRARRRTWEILLTCLNSFSAKHGHDAGVAGARPGRVGAFWAGWHLSGARLAPSWRAAGKNCDDSNVPFCFCGKKISGYIGGDTYRKKRTSDSSSRASLWDILDGLTNTPHPPPPPGGGYFDLTARWHVGVTARQRHGQNYAEERGWNVLGISCGWRPFSV